MLRNRGFPRNIRLDEYFLDSLYLVKPSPVMAGCYVFKMGAIRTKQKIEPISYTNTRVHPHQHLSWISATNVACSDRKDDHGCAPFDMPFHHEWNSSMGKRANVSLGSSRTTHWNTKLLQQFVLSIVIDRKMLLVMLCIHHTNFTFYDTSTSLGIEVRALVFFLFWSTTIHITTHHKLHNLNKQI